ncbi:replication factor C subunit 1 isoform X2 [Daktulosphaira vitifoliae]|uniref:replication factor C subunit 1 isoform X2 n=1 Tax=Daktulosphaira vitifoliae TaxID=58002 RepID=UPI0021AB00EB|nr:replication factor C subunit 1 isoform X2 [Daktulosphaira vitifoliae]
MSRDIRSFFMKDARNNPSTKEKVDITKDQKKKSRKRHVLSSDEEDEIVPTSNNCNLNKHTEKSLKLEDIFGNEPVKQTSSKMVNQLQNESKSNGNVLNAEITTKVNELLLSHSKSPMTKELQISPQKLKSSSVSQNLKEHQINIDSKSDKIVSSNKIKSPTLDSCSHVKSNSKRKISPLTTPENKKFKHGGLNSDSQESGYGTDSVQSSSSSVSSNIPESVETKLWVDKYKPISLKQIIGQTGDKSNVNKLLKWLKVWYTNHGVGVTKKLTRPSPWAKDDDGSFFKAALLSGSPGVGKTTTAHLVCKELGFDIVEFNASDTRSKKQLQNNVSELLSSTSLSPYLGGKSVTKKHALLMDEVDGMAGNEDRGGVQELVLLIKNSKCPIICMCNDRNHPKIRTLANYCFDLRFHKPRLEQIKASMMSVCFKEKLKISPEILSSIIASTDNDIRLTLNHLSIIAAGKDNLNINKKYVKMGPWDVVRKVFSSEEHKTMSINDKCDLFFYDYNISPLFVQENYLSVIPHDVEGPKWKKFERYSLAADSISYGDIVSAKIRSSNNWSLLPAQAIFCSYCPGEFLKGHISKQINFPAWLGKFSKGNKMNRLLQEVQIHTRIRLSASKEAINLDYLTTLRNSILRPLQEKLTDGVQEALDFMQYYQLSKEDLESLNELTTWPGSKDPMSDIPAKVKSAFTRAYNKSCVTFHASRKKKATITDDQEGLLDDEDTIEIVSEEEDDDIQNDTMISIKKKPTKKGSSSPPTSKTQGTSKGRSGGAGRKKK